jgi:hypothetical protein
VELRVGRSGIGPNLSPQFDPLSPAQVNTGGDPTSILLRSCASKSANFYEIKQADQIAALFTDIGTRMTQLRLAK